MELDSKILNACRIVPLDILLHDSVKYPQNLPVYVEVVVSEGRIPSEYLTIVADFPRYREACIRGYRKLWKSFSIEETEKSIIVDLSGIDDFDGNREDLRTKIRGELVYNDKTVVLSKRACDCVLDLYWLENRDDCRLHRTWSDSDIVSNVGDHSVDGTTTSEKDYRKVSYVQSLAKSDQISIDQEGDGV